MGGLKGRKYESIREIRIALFWRIWKVEPLIERSTSRPPEILIREVIFVLVIHAVGTNGFAEYGEDASAMPR